MKSNRRPHRETIDDNASATPITLCHRNPMYKHANGDFLSKKLHIELQQPQQLIRPCSKRATNESTLLFDHKLLQNARLRSRKTKKRSMMHI